MLAILVTVIVIVLAIAKAIALAILTVVAMAVIIAKVKVMVLREVTVIVPEKPAACNCDLLWGIQSPERTWNLRGRPFKEDSSL